MGLNLFVHAVRLIQNDWRTALRITGILYLICAVPSTLLVMLSPPPTTAAQAAEWAAGFALPAMISMVLYLVAFIWMAVAWHRYVLLDEYPRSLLPAFNGSRMFSYFLYSMLLGLIGMAAWFVIVSILGWLPVIGPILAAIVGLAALLIISYRLGPILPATAIGKPMTLGEAWAATSKANTTIIVLAIVSAVAALVIDIPAFLLAQTGQFGAFLAMLWTLVTGWIKLIVGCSILTTIYGHYVEGRAIPSN